MPIETNETFLKKLIIISNKKSTDTLFYFNNMIETMENMKNILNIDWITETTKTSEHILCSTIINYLNGIGIQTNAINQRKFNSEEELIKSTLEYLQKNQKTNCLNDVLKKYNQTNCNETKENLTTKKTSKSFAY